MRRTSIVGIATSAVLAALILSTPVAADDAEYSVLLIGNSHSSRGGLPDMLQQLLESGGNVPANVKVATGWNYLAERLDDNRTEKILDSQHWSHVVLQAQKYSTSGKYTYPTDAAEEWIRRSRSTGAEPIMFPEWARRGNTEEGTRIHRLHQNIAAREPACVAPVGIAWEVMLDSYPEVRLHANDGNHANRKGALLTAYVLYATITGQSVRELPEIGFRGISVEVQTQLRSAADKAIAMAPPCRDCVSR